MVWNPLDRRSKDQRAIDDSIVGLARPSWSESSSESTRFVRLALESWRAVVNDADARTAAEHRRLDRVRKAVQRTGASHKLDVVEAARVKALRGTIRGRIVLAVVVLAAAVEDLDAWTADEVAHRLVRIDLADEVSAVARSAYLLESAIARLGAAPTGHLADDDEVMRIYRSRTEALADRQRVLIGRLSSLRSYYDGLASMQRELERIRWIRFHSEPDFTESAVREQDELGSMTLSAAREMFDEATDRFGDQMRDAAERLRGPV
ncbi:MAG: hypothetical protein WA931_09155 [Rhodococcus sp. (in: high G+C Gram-positive bacteria)]